MALDADVRRRFEHYLDGDRLPEHLILYGPPGFGKTSIAKIIEKALYAHEGLPRVRWVKAAETGNVENIRDSVLTSMRLKPGPRLMIFEEASGLSREAQEALRVPLESYEKHCRVIFITNHLEKLDAAVQSRCAKIEMARPPVQECARVLQRIVEDAGFSVAPADVLAFAREHFAADEHSDLRSLLASAQHHLEMDRSLPRAPEPAGGTTVWDRWEEIEPGPAEEGARLLNDLTAEFSKYVSLPQGGAEALALWTVFAWAHEAFSVSPILTLASPTMRAGKSTVFEMLEQLLIPDATHHPSNITSAVVYRLKGLAEEDQAVPSSSPKPPTLCLLLDEADEWLGLREDIRSILNSGHTRRGAFVYRMDGTKEVGRFSSWYPKALALIDRPVSPLPHTLRDRSIVIPMQRMKAGEKRLRFPRHRTSLSELETLRKSVEHWAVTHFDELRDLAGGELLSAEELNDRAKDNWQPLMAIARIAGGGWEDRARRASLTLSDSSGDQELLIELLGDIREVFDAEGLDRIRSAALVQKLAAMEARPWKEARLSPSKLAKMIRPLQIRSRQLWIDPGIGQKTNKQGYSREQFEDAFERYL